MTFLNKSSDSKDRGGKANNPGGTLAGLPLQAKLRIGQPNDAFEQEADRTADRVVNSPDSTAHDTVRRQPEEEKPVQTSRFLQKQAEEEEPVQTQAEEEEEPVQTQAQEEEEPVQTQAEEEEKEPIRTQPEEEEQPVQTQAEEEKPVQAKAITDSEIADPETEQLLAASKSGGEPMEAELLQEMENKFGSRFSHVRIHTDSTAVEFCRKFNAKAFTHGSHIYFNEGNYDSGSSEGKRLLAHELTHVIQQNGRIERKLIQRTNEDSDGSIASSTSPGFIVDTSNSIITFDEIRVPPFKVSKLSGKTLRREAGRIRSQDTESNTQRDTWIQEMGQRSDGPVRQYLTERITRHFRQPPSASRIYVFEAADGYQSRNTRRFIGILDTVIRELSIPTWDRSNRSRSFQVDHEHDYQLGGVNNVNNYWLLNEQTNINAGRRIWNNIQRSARKVTEEETRKPEDQQRQNLMRVNRILSEYHLVFETPVPDTDFNPSDSPLPPRYFWERNEIAEGKHVHRSEVSEIDRLLDVSSLERLGSDENVLIFPFETGGVGKQFANRDRVMRGNREHNWLEPWIIENKHFNTESGEETNPVFGYFDLKLYDNQVSQAIDSERLQINRYTGARFCGYLSVDRYFTQDFGRLVAKDFSPIHLDSVRTGPAGGFIVRGHISPSIPFIEETTLDFAIEDGQLIISKTFDTGAFNVPAPFVIEGSSLTIAASSRDGLSIRGQIDFGIENVGEGFIGAAASSSGGFELEGEFNFDSDLFTPARVNVTYRDNTFGVTGEIGIPESKVRGIKSATITVSYTEGTLTAEGEAELDVPGVESGNMQVVYGDEGFSISGTFNLSNDIPGIRSGSVSATVRKVAGEEGYQLTASGTAVPDIPGIDSQLTVEYDNGAITISGEATYNRGLLSGQINVGATNRALDSEGQPTGDPTDNIIVYGGGSLTVRITPWLQGTVGVQFEPNGEIVVSGSIGLPGPVEVFRRFGMPERELFGIGFDIPIFAIPVGPRSIGLVASIRGGLNAHAGIGPGRLDQLELGIEYNPARPEDTHITGQGLFVIPAEAGLSLFVRATIGLSAVIGGVEGGLELSAGIGLEAAAEADVNIDWTPTSGLELNASLSAHVEPKFVFTIDGLIRAWFAFYEEVWRWRLANFEYGSNMRFGVTLPIHYREGEPFNISFDDLVIERPDIDARSLLGGLIRNIRNRRA